MGYTMQMLANMQTEHKGEFFTRPLLRKVLAFRSLEDYEVLCWLIFRSDETSPQFNCDDIATARHVLRMLASGIDYDERLRN